MTQLTDKTEIRKLLRPIIWIIRLIRMTDMKPLWEIQQQAGSFTQEKTLVRMIEYLGWYDPVRLFGFSGLSKVLTKDERCVRWNCRKNMNLSEKYYRDIRQIGVTSHSRQAKPYAPKSISGLNM